MPGSPEIESPAWGQQVVVLLFYSVRLAPERMTKVALKYSMKTSVILSGYAQPAKILDIDRDVETKIVPQLGDQHVMVHDCALR